MSGRQSAAADQAVRLVRAGLSFRAAAAKAGCSLSTAQRACAAAGVVSANRVGRPAQQIALFDSRL